MRILRKTPWSPTRSCLGIGLAVLLGAPVLLGAQAPAAAGASQAPTFRSEAELVVLHVTVRDRRGDYVNGLRPDAFHLYENGLEQPLSIFMHQDEPVTIGLIIDSSGSMQASGTRVAFAASQFATSGRPEDEIFAIVVGDEPRPVLPADRPFTNDPVELQHAVAAALRPGGRTALYDAINEGLDYLARGTHERRALVVLSDGVDNASTATFEDVRLRTQASNAAVYAIVLADPIRVSKDPGHLGRLARASGGEAHYPATHVETFRAMREVAEEIRNAYAVGFIPTRSVHDGRYHRLKVAVTSPSGTKLTVRTREGYLAGVGSRQ